MSDEEMKDQARCLIKATPWSYFSPSRGTHSACKSYLLLKTTEDARSCEVKNATLKMKAIQSSMQSIQSVKYFVAHISND